MPYRIDVPIAADDALDRLIELGALDVERADDGAVTALMPDHVMAEEIAADLGVPNVIVSPALGRDDGSVWVLTPRATVVAGLRIAPDSDPAAPGTLRLLDSAAFGTGLHPTTALCLEAIAERVRYDAPASLLDVGTGSGILSLGALLMGVPRAVGLDVDDDALRVATRNATLNGLDARVEWLRGGPEAVTGAWPLVVANVLPAPLIEMAPHLVRRVGHRGLLILSGISEKLAAEVAQAYKHLGMQPIGSSARDGWVALVMQASW